jgi:hypothetical protein
MEWDLVKYQDVLAAIQECDALGEEEFLAVHHFEPARGYHLLPGGASYPSKAILDVAYGHATGSRAKSSEFSGGKDGAAKVLRGLGFEVAGPDR